MPLTNEFYWTFAIFATTISTAGTMSWLERRPRKGLEPRLLPTTPIILVSGTVAILSFVHLLNLYGIHTGRPQ